MHIMVITGAEFGFEVSTVAVEEWLQFSRYFGNRYRKKSFQHASLQDFYCHQTAVFLTRTQRDAPPEMVRHLSIW
jgi:hypothetical protein